MSGAPGGTGAVTPPAEAVVARLADELLDATHAREPVLATLSGFRDRDAELGDPSEAGEAATADRVAAVLAAARAVEPAGLSSADRVTRAVVEAHAAATLDRIRARGVEQITPLYVSPAAQLLYGLPMIEIAEPAHAEAYLARLRRVPDLLAALADRHRAGQAAGRGPVRRLVEAAVAQLDRHLADRDGDPLRRPGPTAAFAVARDRVLDDVVRPAFARYRTEIAALAPDARPDERAGLCWLPAGAAAYDGLVRAYTTTPRTAADLHRTGLELLERLAGEYRDATGLGPADLFPRLRADPALRWRNAAEPLAAARAAVARAERAAPRWFGRLPRAGCRVEEMPAEAASGGPPGYHDGAALDGSRPCVYLVNTDRATERDRFSAEAVAYHEAVPGHHVQVGLARELAGLPPLRRVVPVDAFAEGWALYAERLADEMGLYTDGSARIGMLAGDSLRAARLVADTGLHAHGWDRARAIDFLRRNTPLTDLDVAREVDRYLADPGQALAYMVGRLEIERLRDRATRALADRALADRAGGKPFDIRDFHDAVLANGEVPLGTLAEVVEEWIAAGGGTVG